MPSISVELTQPRLLLASTSTYRAELVKRLRLSFEAVAPAVDEALVADETAPDRASRLAREKSTSVAQQEPGTVVIGSDQVAAIGTAILRKPGNAAAQRAQLQQQAGQQVDFHTALCVIDANGRAREYLDHTRCHLRRLTPSEIERYVEVEPAYDCAGGFKVEGLGIALFSAVHSGDPSALIGLPLIALSACLRECGIQVP